MDIRESKEGNRTVLRIVGRLDTATAPDLDSYIRSNQVADGLVLDLSELEYISSAGLRVLLAANKLMANHGGMSVRNVQDMVMEVLEATGFTDVLTME